MFYTHDRFAPKTIVAPSLNLGSSSFMPLKMKYIELLTTTGWSIMTLPLRLFFKRYFTTNFPELLYLSKILTTFFRGRILPEEIPTDTSKIQASVVWQDIKIGEDHKIHTLQLLQRFHNFYSAF